MEIEIKLALDERAVARFRRQSALREGKPAREALYSLYFDTPDFDLLGRGIALRLRRVGLHWVQTVKARAGAGGLLSERPEWETQVAGNRPDPAVLPEDVRALIPAGLWPRLGPVFATQFKRTIWQVRQGRSRIEVALDRGVIRAGSSEWPISEVELELESGRIADLIHLAERLVDDLPFHLEPRSKAQRGYQLAGAIALAPVKAAAPTLEPGQPATAAFAAIARACLDQFEANLPGLLQGDVPDPEYLHQMRVALRRLRAAVGLLRFMGIEQPAWVAELKWLMGELSPARDWDVLVTETLPRVRAALPSPDPLDALAGRAGQLRRQALVRARAAASSPRLVRLWLAMERDLNVLPEGGVDTEGWANASLERRFRQMRRLGRRLDELGSEERHALRIAGKKLRYAAEFFAGLHPKRSRRFITCLAQLQDRLGVLNDVAVTGRLLTELKQDASPQVWEGAGLVAGYLARELQEHLAGLAPCWQDFHRIEPYWRAAAKRKGAGAQP